MSTSKSSAFRRCIVCSSPISPKKLVLVRGGLPAHRACRPVTGVPVQAAKAAAAASRAAAPKPDKPMSRAEMLRQIDELRRRDARKKAAEAAGTASAKKVSPRKAAARKDAPAVRGRGRSSAAPAAVTRSGAPVSRQPQPYYGVEMKSVGGQWVQMHPESE
ncbi:hypothetical protein ACFWWS_27600 [Streptomyces sp. NPDC059083]|uniref:hypothetical protein n=1 Tax=Streptomyces sp. NPDC059083 TaxID=3346721 RepID=UPI0036C96A09